MAFMDDISKKNKLNSQISEKEREINKLFAQIGQQYYALHKENAEPELAAMVKAVDEAKKVILRNQERLDFANGVTQCPNCGKKVELSAQFCNGCGSRVPVPRRIIPTPEGNICIQCGAVLQDGQKFCVGCGTRLVEEPVAAAPVQPVAPPVVEAPPAPVAAVPPVAEAPSVQPEPMPAFKPAPAGKTCAKCGAAMGDDQLFCVMCGAKAEEPAPVAAPAGKTCVKCGAALEDGQAFCIMCGTKVEDAAAPKLCPNCGKELLEGAAFCIGCGARI